MEKKTKTMLAVVVVAIAVVGVSLFIVFQGEQITSEKLVTVPLSTLALTLDDLPEGYSGGFPRTNCIGGHDFIDIPTECYRNSFESGEGNETDPENYTINNFVYSELFKFNTTDAAKNNYIRVLGDALLAVVDGETINESIDSIGDQSIAIIDHTFNETQQIILHYRKLNVVGIILAYNVSYSHTYDLAKIIEQRIYDNLT